MKDLLREYKHTIPRYGEFHSWLRQRAPKVLAVWGRHDPFFIPAGAQAYRSDVPDAEVILLGTGHFALEEEADTIATTVDAFLTKHLG